MIGMAKRERVKNMTCSARNRLPHNLNEIFLEYKFRTFWSLLTPTHCRIFFSVFFSDIFPIHMIAFPSDAPFKNYNILSFLAHQIFGFVAQSLTFSTQAQENCEFLRRHPRVRLVKNIHIIVIDSNTFTSTCYEFFKSVTENV